MRRLDFSSLILSMLPYLALVSPPGIWASCCTPGPIRIGWSSSSASRDRRVLAAQPCRMVPVLPE